MSKNTVLSMVQTALAASLVSGCQLQIDAVMDKQETRSIQAQIEETEKKIRALTQDLSCSNSSQCHQMYFGQCGISSSVIYSTATVSEAELFYLRDLDTELWYRLQNSRGLPIACPMIAALPATLECQNLHCVSVPYPYPTCSGVPVGGTGVPGTGTAGPGNTEYPQPCTGASCSPQLPPVCID